jgi:hypothetical protein
MKASREQMPLKCSEVRELLPAYARDRAGSLNIRRHLSSCEDCRTELHRYEELIDAMGSLQHVTTEMPRAALSAILDIPSQPTRLETLRDVAGKTSEAVSSHRSAVLGGVAAAALAGAGALVWRQRRRLAAA